MSNKTNNIVSIPVDRDFAKWWKIQASMRGISRLELSRIEAKNMQQSVNQTNKRKNEENSFPFRF